MGIRWSRVPIASQHIVTGPNDCPHLLENRREESLSNSISDAIRIEICGSCGEEISQTHAEEVPGNGG